MNKLILCSLLSAMFFVSGCVIRTYTTEMDRVDQEIRGNRGVIMGVPSEAVETEPQVKKTRTIYNVEVELPSGYRTEQEVKDKELYGNRGYIKGNITPEKEVFLSGPSDSARMPQVVYSEPSGNEALSAGGKHKQVYVVQKGDTLQKISEKFFGTTKKWKSIYDLNKQVLKSPDRIRAGQKLLIP